MYTKFKYVVGHIGRGLNPVLSAVVVSEVVSHSDLRPLFNGKIVGAGFGYVTEDLKVVVYGESVGLNVGSSEADVMYVSHALALPGAHL